MNTSVPAWADADLVMISALQHWSYCPRQCGLIHLDQVWDENLYTLIHEPSESVSFGGLPFGPSRDDAFDLVLHGLEVAQAGPE